MIHILKPLGACWLFVLLLFSCASSHDGKQQESGINVISSANRITHSVYLTKNHKGLPVISWTEQDTTENKQNYFYFSALDPSKNDFGHKVSIPITQNASLHTEGMPKIAFKKTGDIIAVYQVRLKSAFNPYAGEIHYIISKDGGNNWSEPTILHSSRTPHQGRAFFDMMTLVDGEIGVSWLGESHKTGGRPVMFAKTNTANAFVNELVVDSLACECCRTAIYADEHGAISIVYRDIIKKSIRDISISVSQNNGDTFSNPVCFSGDNWNINGCPHNGPDVVSDKDSIYASWFTGGVEAGVYYAKLDKETLGAEKKLISKKARNIQLAPNDGASIVVYNDSYNVEGEFYDHIIAMNTASMEKTVVNDTNKKAHSPVIIEWGDKNIVGWLEKDGDADIALYSMIKKPIER